ncbi:unnamed protein product [Protopolystoma xenopodis]|uniref:Uncharacterized protein n=1 Tax=Protopolystoma xenopodis TaxID=117903 RepID=A0A3S5CRM5_9PLAT|nr:unnamed protein product [Protopolystoma xenopodis]
MVSTGAKRVASLVESQEDKSPPAKKCARARTVAILIINPLFITIEGELLKALLAAGLISNEQFERPSKLRDFDNVVPALNSSLPDDIRVLDVFRTTRSFHAKGNASHRVYKYIMPSFALAPKDEFIIASTQHEYRITAERVIEVNELLHHYVGTHNFYNFTSRRQVFIS